MATKKKKAKEKLVIPFTPHLFQEDFFRGFKRFNVAVCHRRFGKTDMAIIKLIKSALQNTKPSPCYAYLAPTLKQAKRITWRKFRTYLAPLIKANKVKMRESECEITFLDNNAVIYLYGTDNNNADSIVGSEFDGVVCDEFGLYQDDVWEIVEPTLHSRDGWVLFISTPRGRNKFYEFYIYGQSDPDWQVKMYRLSDTHKQLFETGSPFFAWCGEGEYERILRRASMNMNKHRREMECDFDADVEDILVPQSMVLESRAKSLKPEQYNFEPIIFGVDVAFSETGDNSSIVCRQGLAVLDVWSMQGLDNMALADVVARKAQQWQPDGIFIDQGRGEGVWSRLRQLKISAMMVDFGSRSTDPARFENKRAEIWWAIREWLENGGTLPDDEGLCTDIVTPTYKDEYGKILLERKKSMKKRIGRSPDKGDALALTFSMPVRKKGRTKFNQGGVEVVTTANTKYRPLDRRR